MTQEQTSELLAEVQSLIRDREREGVHGLSERVGPAEWADLVPQLDPEEVTVLLHWLPDSEIPELLEELSPTDAAAILRRLTRRDAALLLGEMDPDDAADVVERIPAGEADEILVQMRPEEASEIRDLSVYSPGTAELLITREWAILAGENDYTTGAFQQITGSPPAPSHRVPSRPPRGIRLMPRASSSPDRGRRLPRQHRPRPGYLTGTLAWLRTGLQQLVEPDRQVADPDPGGVVHRAGDGGRRADDADLADPLGPGRVESGSSSSIHAASMSCTSQSRDVVPGQVVVGVVAEPRVHDALLVQRHGQPMVIPPISCDRAGAGLTMRPAAKTPSSRGTRTSPVSASTRASTNWAPKAYRAWRGSAPMSAAVSACALRPPDGTAPSLARNLIPQGPAAS